MTLQDCPYMKNIKQMKDLIIGCCYVNTYEVSITVYLREYSKKVEIISWDRIDIRNNSTIALNTVHIFSYNHIAFNLSYNDAASITIYGPTSGLKIQTYFKNGSSRLSILYEKY